MEGKSTPTFFNTREAAKRLAAEWREHGKIIISLDFDGTVYDFHNRGDQYSEVIIGHFNQQYLPTPWLLHYHLLSLLNMNRFTTFFSCSDFVSLQGLKSVAIYGSETQKSSLAKMIYSFWSPDLTPDLSMGWIGEINEIDSNGPTNTVALFHMINGQRTGNPIYCDSDFSNVEVRDTQKPNYISIDASSFNYIQNGNDNHNWWIH